MVTISNCTAIRESSLALLIKLPGGREVWIPKSAIHDDSEVFDGKNNAEGKLVAQDWWAEKEQIDEVD